jgi:hypothetical protein
MHRLAVAAAVAWVIMAPGLAWAQGASITGVVRDASGAVLPGVTVEVSSPALIEKVRSVVTDGTGQYRIVDLRPGTYSITATLAGFSTVKRDGIELTGTMVAAIPLELRVGALEETITVTGETPIVDVQSVRRQVSVDNEVISSIPSARAYGAIMNLIPSVGTQGGAAADVQIAPNMTVFGGQGGRGNEGRLQVDGLGTGAPLNGAGVSTYIADVGNAQEITFTTSGGLGEAEVGGPTISIVPKTGGNSFRGQLYFAGVNDAMVSSNFDEELRAAGLATPGQLIKLWDYNFGVGGPIKRDRLWFYGTYRDEGNYRSIPGIFPNKNAGDPAKWTYEADTSRQAQGAESWRIATLRLTLQATQRNKFNIYWDEQSPCNGAAYFGGEGCREQPESGAVVGPLGLGGLSSTTSPEVAGYLHTIQRVQQITWTSPATNRLLLEAGLGTFLARWGPQDAPGNPTRELIRVQEQCPASSGCAANGNIPNLNYRSANWASNWSGAHRWRASASYVTGRQSMKVGYQGAFFVENDTSFSNINYLSYRVANGVPNQFTQTINENTRKSRTALSALFAEEHWTLGRLTLQGALRYDHSWSWFPEQTLGPHKWLPTQAVYPRTDGVSYNDITPRAGVAWDLFGTGRTAVKVNIGRYLEPASNGNGNYSVNNPTNRIQSTSSRTWIDADRDFVVDCNLFDQAAQDLRATGGDSCGVGNSRFGTLNPAETYDEKLLNGWFVRPDDWGFAASVQQEVLPRVSVELQYTRRWLSGFSAEDNRATAIGDYTQFSVTAPLDPRLPNGGGYTICCLFDVNPDKAGQTDNFNTLAENFGKRTQVYNGFLLNVSARPGRGLTLQGGINSGSTVQDSCEIRSVLPETALTNPHCHNAPGFVTRVTGLASYVVPKIDVLLSTTFRSDQGAALSANFVYNNAAVAPWLGRGLSAGPNANVTVNLIEPGTEWGDRVNEIDIRVAKILRFGPTRTNIGFDIYNLVNSNAVLNYNQAFIPGGAWLRPTSVLTPRFVKFSAQVDF